MSFLVEGGGAVVGSTVLSWSTIPAESKAIIGHMVSYAAVTRAIKVVVRPFYLDEQSDMLEGRFVFGYHVRIHNQGEEEVQLLRRKWTVRDRNGKTREIEGEGVIGRQPVIPPERLHEYNSYCVLESFRGTMEGTYLMQLPNGERFQVEIPLFHLVAAAN